MPANLSDGEKPRVLVVDDNRACAAICAVVLTEAGCEIDVARDGFEAIVSLQARPYVAVVLDYRLPGMNGPEVLRWMNRNLSDRPPVIVASSDGAEMVAREFNGLGVSAFLTKPVCPSSLNEAVAACRSAA